MTRLTTGREYTLDGVIEDLTQTSSWRFYRQEIESKFRAWLAAHDAEVAANAWDRCLDEIEAYEINTQQARDGNPYRAGRVECEAAGRKSKRELGSSEGSDRG